MTASDSLIENINTKTRGISAEMNGANLMKKHRKGSIAAATALKKEGRRRSSGSAQALNIYLSKQSVMVTI